MNKAVAAIVRESRAHACIECGKCSAACSMAAMYADFSADSSPRGMVQLALRQARGLGAGIEERFLWRCLQCGNCSAACPERVDCAKLFALLRAVTCGPQARYCAGCGRELPSVQVQEWLRNTLDPDGTDTDEASPGTDAYLKLCPVCRRQVYAANNAAG
jgi:L-lactate utilization protein LutB